MYTFFNITLLNIKKKNIREPYLSRKNKHGHKRTALFLESKISLTPSISYHGIKRSTKGSIHDHLAFLKLLTIYFTTTCIEVLNTIKGKGFMQYPLSMKSGANNKNPIKFCLIHYDHGYDTKEFYALK